jgi:hypothetical protein
MKVYVNGAVYRNFLQEGGSNEVLLGNLLQAQKEVRLDALLEKKDLLEATWARHYAQNKALFDQKRLLQMRDSLVREWDCLTSDYSPEDFPVHERASSRAMIERLSYALQPQDFDDLSALSLKLCCTARFFKTDAFEILTGMKRAQDTNPGLAKEESANIAITELTARWVARAMYPMSANKVEVFTAKDTMSL